MNELSEQVSKEVFRGLSVIYMHVANQYVYPSMHACAPIDPEHTKSSHSHTVGGAGVQHFKDTGHQLPRHGTRKTHRGY